MKRHTLFLTTVGVILIVMSSANTINRDNSNSIALGLEFLFISHEGERDSITSSPAEAIITPISSNLTNSTNSSNVTGMNSNLTNKSSNLNTTIPEQLPPESVNGSKSGKI